MTTRKLLSLAGAVVAVISLMFSVVACGGNPTTAPTTTQTCPDPLANNKGQPLPCTYATVAKSSIATTRVSPEDGATLNYRTSDASAHVVYDVALSDASSGDTILARACLSIDGSTATPICFSLPAPGTHGENDLPVHVNLQFNPEATRTNYVIAYLVAVHGVGSSAQSERELARSTFPRTLLWQ